MFKDLPTPVALEEEVLASWKSSQVFETSLEARRDAPRFVFYEGPPTANGMPHNGHVLTRAMKDLFPRYKTMRGFRVDRMAGWDTHGLPVEIEVEKQLGVRFGGGAAPEPTDCEQPMYRNAREAVLAYGLDKFAHKCVDSVFKYTSEWEQLTERIGFWVDTDEAYVTFHREYVESVWWALSVLFDRGLLYQGHKSVWWWPEGGTALSSHEVGEGYRDVDDPSVTVRFRVKGEENTFLLAWTTTPWTLPSNVALAVGAELSYAKVRTEDGQILIAAEALAPEGDVLEVVKGADLVGLTYEPLYDWATPEGRAYEVLSGDHVTLEAGSGIVHIAPAYGEADFDLGKREDLALLMLVGPDGHFPAEGVPEWVANAYFKDADKPIMRDLTERGLMFHRGTVRHSYPFSPRSKDDPLMQLARPGWFIRTTAFKAEALRNNQAVNWLPGHIQEGRFGDFLRNNVDWALSRERFWGTPLPIWVCKGCGEMRAFESMKALEDAGATGFDTTVDKHLQVHKPWIDAITCPCKSCGLDMKRVPEVIDCWFDSGCMPFAQFGFPHKNVDRFRDNYPADFISEAVDQTRGWFYSLMMIATMLFDEETQKAYGLDPIDVPRPYRNVIVLGHVGDMTGKKESKSTGNYTSPDLVLRGRMRMKVVPKADVKRGTLSMVKIATRSLELAKHEKLGVSLEEAGEVVGHVSVVPGPNHGKETVAMHPDDMAAWGITESAWFHAPFQAPGADAFRWLFYASNPPWTNTRNSLRAIREGQREFHLRLMNVYSFFSIYANINGFTPEQAVPSDHALDRWILSELDRAVADVTQHMDDYLVYESARTVTDFVDGLSNWYVRRSRSRFWGEGDATTAALSTLHTVLVGLSKLIAPFVPFLADAMFTRLVPGAGSVHLQAWPTDGGRQDDALHEEMALVRELASLGLSARDKVGVRVRQPLRAAEVVLADADLQERVEPLLFLLQDELNVRAIHFSANADQFVDYVVKPNFRALGKRLGKEMKLCAQTIAKASPAAIQAAVQADGYVVELPSGPVTLGADDVLVEVRPKEGFQAAGSARAVVALHADLDDDLREEGLSREIINRIQGERRNQDLGYTDRIEVTLEADDALRAAAERFRDHISHEVLATSLVVAPLDAEGTLDVDGHGLTLTVRPVGA